MPVAPTQSEARRQADRLARIGARYGAALILFNAALQNGKGR